MPARKQFTRPSFTSLDLVATSEKLQSQIAEIHYLLTGPPRLVDSYSTLKFGFFYFSLRHRPSMLIEAIGEALRVTALHSDKRQEVAKFLNNLDIDLKKYRSLLEPGQLNADLVQDERVTSLESKISATYLKLHALPGSVNKVANTTKRPPLTMKRRDEIVRYSRGVIEQLQQMLNSPNQDLATPTFASAPNEYREQVNELIGELRRMNEFLERKPSPSHRNTRQAAGRVSRKAEKFVDTYLNTVSKGAGWVTLTVFLGLLYQYYPGVRELIDAMPQHLKH